MYRYFNKILFYSLILILSFCLTNKSNSEDLKEILEVIQKDLRTLERAVYSESFSATSQNSSQDSLLKQETEDVLSRHLLKLSEILKTFQEFDYRYEEINL
jgi:hypothetical protein